MSCIYKYKGKYYTKDEFYSLVRTTMVQPRTVQKYTKVLFPTGNTASKIEGHSTLEEFKKQKEGRIKELEEKKKTASNNKPWLVSEITNNKKHYFNTEEEANEFRRTNGRENFYSAVPTSSLKDSLKNIEDINREINQLKKELERVEREGFGALKPIYKFYEETVANILKKQGYKPIEITDEFGNKWNEVTLNNARDLNPIQFQKLTSEEKAKTIEQVIKLKSDIQIFDKNINNKNFDSSNLKDDDLALILFNQALGLNLTSVNQLTWDNIKDNIFFEEEDGSLGVKNLAFISGNFLSTKKATLSDFINQKGLFPDYKVFIGESVIYPNVFEALEENEIIKQVVFENLFNLSGAFEQVKKELNNHSPETFIIETPQGKFTFPKRFAAGFFKIASTVELLLKENQSSYIQDYLSNKRKREEVSKNSKKIKPVITQTLTVNDTIVQNVIGLIGNPIIENAIKNNKSVKIQVFSNAEYSEDGIAGWFLPASNTIYLHESMLKPQHLSEGLPLIAHELIHSVTEQSLQFDKNFQREIQSLLDRVKSQSEIKDFYGFKNTSEFLSEAFSSQEFRQLLKDTQFSNTENLSVWQKFVNAILKLFGKNTKYSEKTIVTNAEQILNSIINQHSYKIGFVNSKISDKIYSNTKIDYSKLTAEEKAKTIEQITKEHRSITALKDLAAKLAHRIGGKIKFENRTDVDWKGYNQGNTSVLNEAYMTPDTPFHEILAHPIIRAIKYINPDNQKTNEFLKRFKLNNSEFIDESDIGEGYFRDNKRISEEEFNEAVNEYSKVAPLYKSLLKELETGRGKEVFEQVKRDYKYKRKKYKTGKILLDDLDFDGEGNPQPSYSEEELERDGDEYTLEEQQEEAIVTLLGLMAADKLDAKKDASLISKLKELWKQISDFVKSLLTGNISENEINTIIENEVTYTDEENKPCAKDGIRSSKFTKGSQWEIVKDLKGYPSHAQGGVDITLGKDGFSFKGKGRDIKAAYGLVLPKIK